RNVIRVGEDVAVGQPLLSTGRTLRPQDVGLLAAIGVRRARVVRRPRVAILVTGNEVVPPGSKPKRSQIVDRNSPMLEALAVRDGAEALITRHVRDNRTAIRKAVAKATAKADIVLMTGGTSVGSEDHAAAVVSDLGELAIHGVHIRPAKPMGVGFLPQ